jgi:hypothetical protein
VGARQDNVVGYGPCHWRSGAWCLDCYDRYNGLIALYNRLRVPHNNLVREYNSECAR